MPRQALLAEQPCWERRRRRRWRRRRPPGPRGVPGVVRPRVPICGVLLPGNRRMRGALLSCVGGLGSVCTFIAVRGRCRGAGCVATPLRLLPVKLRSGSLLGSHIAVVPDAPGARARRRRRLLASLPQSATASKHSVGCSTHFRRTVLAAGGHMPFQLALACALARLSKGDEPGCSVSARSHRTCISRSSSC